MARREQAQPAAAGATSRDVASVARVLRTEAAGLLALADRLDPRIGEAVERLSRVSGRVIVTGMGKSGHVARKIAATLASTGTPAMFVHPAEASHGDLGMVTPSDAVLALSNSGNTAELGDIIGYAKRFCIPLVAITAGEGSMIAEAADVVLLLPDAAEACPMGLAPTTSTTMMLALGDALAVALLERRGFTADEFQRLHPGGQLGRRLLRVSDIMHCGEAMPLVARAALMSEAIIEMTAKGKGCVGVLDDGGRLVGIVTDGDLRRHMGPHLLAQTVEDVMTRKPRTIRPQALAAEALGLMNNPELRPVTSLFAVEADRPVGIVHIHDCLRAGIA